MKEEFKVEIINPEKIIFSDNASAVTLPSYEGEMTVLNNHISIITFLRPGLIKLEKSNDKLEKFFIQDGIVEYFNDNLVILSSSVIDVKNISKDLLDNINKDTLNRLEDKNISDKDRYMLNHKLDTLSQLRV